MGVNRKYEKEKVEPDIDEFINAAGKTKEESIALQYSTVSFNLRLPRHLVEKIDRKRKSNLGFISRNQWIIEALARVVEENE